MTTRKGIFAGTPTQSNREQRLFEKICEKDREIEQLKKKIAEFENTDGHKFQKALELHLKIKGIDKQEAKE